MRATKVMEPETESDLLLGVAECRDKHEGRARQHPAHVPACQDSVVLALPWDSSATLVLLLKAPRRPARRRRDGRGPLARRLEVHLLDEPVEPGVTRRD